MPDSLPLNFAVIGAAKSGTTALCQYLSQHDDVFITNPKEPHYLALGGQTPAFTGPGDDITINAKSVWTPDEYRALYRHADASAIGEGSVSSLYYPSQTIAALKEQAKSDIKLICILRNPAERAWSAYNYLRARTFETENDFEAALRLEPKRIEQGYHHMWHYRRMGLYDEQLGPFVANFHPDQLLVLRHEDLRDEPLLTLNQVCSFLGLDDFVPGWTPNPHRSGRPRSKVVARALSVDSRWKSVLKTVFPMSARSKVRTTLTTATVERVRLDPDSKRRLVDFYRPHVEAVERLVDLDLTSWKQM